VIKVIPTTTAVAPAIKGFFNSAVFKVKTAVVNNPNAILKSFKKSINFKPIIPNKLRVLIH
jgi:hypothetical protein